MRLNQKEKKITSNIIQFGERAQTAKSKRERQRKESENV